MDTTVERKVLDLFDIMRRMPSGLFDRRAAHKLRAELREFEEANGPERLAEAADVAYYATKLVCYTASIQDRNCAYWTVLFWDAVCNQGAREGAPETARASGHELVAIVMEEALRAVAAVERALGVWPGASLDLAIAKYSLRARPGNPKDHAAEVAACQEVINGTEKQRQEQRQGL